VAVDVTEIPRLDAFDQLATASAAGEAGLEQRNESLPPLLVE
jgi:hypothetical protein